jgi:hypothetical protein
MLDIIEPTDALMPLYRAATELASIFEPIMRVAPVGPFPILSRLQNKKDALS